jgi:Cys-tRNA(Pro) deacylase
MSENNLSAGAQKVQSALATLKISAEVLELPSSTRTAQDAANTLGCQVAEIAKSLIFETSDSHRPVLVIASGTNRVDEKKLAELVGEKMLRASPDFVHERTGFAIGGVPPLGHKEALQTFIDEDLKKYSVLWAAAGSPRAVFKTNAEDLLRMTAGAFAKLAVLASLNRESSGK